MKSYEIKNVLLKELSDLVDARHQDNLNRLNEQHSLANEASQSETGLILAMLSGQTEAPWSAAPDVHDPASVRKMFLSEIRTFVQNRRDDFAARLAIGYSEPHEARLIESNAIIKVIDLLSGRPVASCGSESYRPKRIPAPLGFNPRRHSGCILVNGRLLPYTRDKGPDNRSGGLLLITVHHPDAPQFMRVPVERLIRKRQIRMPRRHGRRCLPSYTS